MGTANAHESDWARLARTTNPDEVLAVANDGHTSGLRNIAMLRSADMWLAKAMRDSSAIYLSYAKFIAYGMPDSEDMIEDDLQA